MPLTGRLLKSFPFARFRFAPQAEGQAILFIHNGVKNFFKMRMKKRYYWCEKPVVLPRFFIGYWI